MECDIILGIDDDLHILFFRQSALHQISDLQHIILFFHKPQLLTIVGILIRRAVVQHSGSSHYSHHRNGKHHQHALLVIFRITLETFQFLTQPALLIRSLPLDRPQISSRSGLFLTLLTFFRQLRLFLFRRSLFLRLALDP